MLNTTAGQLVHVELLPSFWYAQDSMRRTVVGPARRITLIVPFVSNEKCLLFKGTLSLTLPFLTYYKLSNIEARGELKASWKASTFLAKHSCFNARCSSVAAFIFPSVSSQGPTARKTFLIYFFYKLTAPMIKWKKNKSKTPQLILVKNKL